MVSDSNSVLFGRRTGRTRRTLGVAITIFLCTFLIGVYARGRWMQAVMETTLQPVLFVILVGGGLTIWNAYWNDGLLMSWLLMFSLVTPWLIHYNLQLGIYWPFVSAGYVTLALVVSTVGYLIGVGFRRVSLGETEEGVAKSFPAVFGSASGQTTRWFLLSSGLFVVPAGLVYVAGPYRSLLVSIVYPVALFYPIGDVTGRAVIGVGLILGWTGVATWPAYRGNGLLVSWGVLFAPMFGTILSYSLLETFSASDLSSSVVDAVLIATLVSVTISVILRTLGFVIGVLFRRTVAPQQRDHEKIGT